MILSNGYNVTICLETMAGKGTEVGKTFEQLKEPVSSQQTPPEGTRENRHQITRLDFGDGSEEWVAK